MISAEQEKKIADYYAAIGDSEKQELQNLSNQASASIHPITTLEYFSSEMNVLRTREVKFFHKLSKILQAQIFEVFKDATPKRKLTATIGEEKIIHTGWIWHTKVSEMKDKEKEAFISNLCNMKIYKIASDNSTYVW